MRTVVAALAGQSTVSARSVCVCVGTGGSFVRLISAGCHEKRAATAALLVNSWHVLRPVPNPTRLSARLAVVGTAIGSKKRVA